MAVILILRRHNPTKEQTTGKLILPHIAATRNKKS
jgi:hypothetical protein